MIQTVDVFYKTNSFEIKKVRPFLKILSFSFFKSHTKKVNKKKSKSAHPNTQHQVNH